MLPQLDEVFYNGIFAGRRHAKTSGVSVSGDVLSEMFETTVIMSRAFCRFGIKFVQVSEHRFDRSVQTVKIESIESAFAIFERLLIVVLAQPADEIEDVGVSPHPLRKTLEPAQRFHAVAVFARAADKPVDAIRIRPICFHGHGAKAALRNQDLRDLSANPIKLVGAVTRFADQNKARIADQIDK